MTFKPLLAADADLDKIAFPVLASPKIDGIRCLIHPTLGPVTRTLGPIPNGHIRAALSDVPRYLDGELVTYTDGVMDDFNSVQSKVMSADGEPDFHFIAFDSFAEPEAPFAKRLQSIAAGGHVVAHPHIEIGDLNALMAFHADNLANGWEGTMIRKPGARYKFGRSTVREGILLKLKPRQDAEAVIVGFAEQQNHPATLGSLSVRWKKVAFEIGTGFTEAQRIDLWARRAMLVGQSVTFRYQGVGARGAPRFPVFAGIRLDLPSNPVHPAPASSAPRRRRSYEIEWAPMRSATAGETSIDERADDRGDVYVFVNGIASYESFDAAVARATASPHGIEPVPAPTIADLDRLTAPRGLAGRFMALLSMIREGALMGQDIAHFRRQGHEDPAGAARTLAYLDRHYLADFRDFASKRRIAGISLSSSKEVYCKVHLHAENCPALSGEERAWLKRVIGDMEESDALTPDALALERAEVAAHRAEIEAARHQRELDPAERRQYAMLTQRH